MHVRQRAVAGGCACAIWLGVLATACYAKALPTAGLLFASDRNGRFDIVVTTVGGKDLRALTRGDADDFYPAWSPDGEFFAYASDWGGNFDLWVAEADGSDPRQITRDPSLDWAPAWSPDGRRLAFVSERDGGRDLYIIELSSRRVERITRDPELWKGPPAWSPDGRRLAFDAYPRKGRGGWDIYIVDADGADRQRIIDMPLVAALPTWSRDGRSLLFVTSEVGVGSDIFRADADGNGPQNLTQDTDVNTDPEPLTAPDAFAFMSNRDSAPFQYDIHVLSKEAGIRTNITEHPSSNASPSWFDPAFPVPAREAALATWGWLRQLQGVGR